MIWLIGTLCFAIGLCAGAVLFKQFKSDSAKVEQLEKALVDLQLEHDAYKSGVHSHFGDTAQLVNKLTDSYREVYQHLATGAQALCPENISSQLSLSAQSSDPLISTNPEPSEINEASDSTFPPRDYADKSDPDQTGNLSESYGFSHNNKT